MHPKNNHALINYPNIHLHTTNDTSILDNIDLSQFDCVYSPAIPINVSKYPNTKFLFGPHFSVFPEVNQMNVIRGPNTIYLQPSEWAAQVWINNPCCNDITIKALPFGVDIERFNNTSNVERTKIFIYFKHRHPYVLQFVETFLKSKEIEYKVFSYRNKYDENEYLNYLRESKYGIWLDAHESQGFALEEALSTNVPLLVWNVNSMNEEYGQNYSDIPATTIPYFDEICGEHFTEKENFESTFNLFISKLETYKPREYVIENLSMKVCEQKLIDIINNTIGKE
jgi:hypothetical protein